MDSCWPHQRLQLQCTPSSFVALSVLMGDSYPRVYVD